MKYVFLVCSGFFTVLCRPAGALTVDVDFSQTGDPVAFKLGTNEGTVSWGKDETVQYTADVGTDIVRLWIESHLYGQGFGTAPDQMHFELLDPKVQNILNAGAVPMLCLFGPPPYLAEGGDVSGHGRPTSDAAFGEFVAAIAQHYMGIYSGVENWYFEVWNEPDISVVSGPYPIDEYMSLLHEVCLAVHAVDPDLKVAGPSTSGAPQTWVRTSLQLGIDAVTWHRYGSHDVRLSVPTSAYIANAPSCGTVAATVDQWIEEERPGEGVVQFAGEVNFNSAYAPPDPRIWQLDNVPFYTSAMYYLMTNGADGEMTFRGSDTDLKTFGMWTTDRERNLRSPLYWAKRLWADHIKEGDLLTQSSVSDDTTVQAIAVTSGSENRLALIHKKEETTTVNVHLQGHTPRTGQLLKVDEESMGVSGILGTPLPPATDYELQLSGYGFTVLEFPEATQTPLPTFEPTATPPPWTPTPTGGPDPVGNCVRNGDFEDTGSGDFHPPAWTWWQAPGSIGMDVWHDDRSARTGNCGIRLVGSCLASRFDGGIVQRVTELMPGRHYTLTCWSRASHPTLSEHWTTVGLDLSGQTWDCQADTIEWYCLSTGLSKSTATGTREPGTAPLSLEVADILGTEWERFSLGFICQGTQVSVWLRGGTMWDTLHFSDFDDVSIVKTDASGVEASYWLRY